MRFLADLVNCHVIVASSLLTMFDSLVEVTLDDNISQVSRCNRSNVNTTKLVTRYCILCMIFLNNNFQINMNCRMIEMKMEGILGCKEKLLGTCGFECR